MPSRVSVYARVLVPPAYKTETAQVVTREASERVEMIPARYEKVTEQVLVREASKKVEVVPETYEWVEEKILVRPVSERIVEVPAVYETVKETVVDRPANSVWKKGEGPIQKVDYATGEIMCLVEVPATYKTVTKTVLKTRPRLARSRSRPSTPQSKTSYEDPIHNPRGRDSGRVQDRGNPEAGFSCRGEAASVPAEQQSVTKTVVASEGRIEWQPVLCETNASPELIKTMHLQPFAAKGAIPGKMDGS